MVDKVQALPIKSFEYGGHIRTPMRGAFMIDRRAARELEAMGHLTIIANAPNPTRGAGVTQYASPAAPASPKKTSRRSKRGEEQEEGSSS